MRRCVPVVRMAERSKALRSGRSPLLWAWVRIPLLTYNFLYSTDQSEVNKFIAARVSITQKLTSYQYVLINFIRKRNSKKHVKNVKLANSVY